MGRNAKTAAEKQASGNPGKRAIVEPPADDLPVLEGDAPFELSARGQKIFKDLSEQLAHVKLLRATDSASLARYCDTLDAYWKVTDELRKSDHTYEAETTNGGKLFRVHPLVMVQDRLARRLDVAEDRFGLTPRSRQEIYYRLAALPPAQPQPLPGMDDDVDPAPPTSPVGFLKGAAGGYKVH